MFFSFALTPIFLFIFYITLHKEKLQPALTSITTGLKGHLRPHRSIGE